MRGYAWDQSIVCAGLAQVCIAFLLLALGAFSFFFVLDTFGNDTLCFPAWLLQL